MNSKPKNQHNMKAFLIATITFLIFSITCNAQWTNDASPSLTTGNAGIGTTTPLLKLHIAGPFGFPATSGTTQTAIFRLQGTNSNAVLDFGVNSGSGGILQVTNQTDLSMEYPLLLNPNGGNVGIGTTTPQVKAHIVGGLGFPANTGTTQTGVLRLQGAGNNGVLDFSVNGASGAALQATALNDLTQEYPLLLNPNGGNVGIGTTAPENKLHIVDVAGTSSINLQLAGNTLNETIGISFGTQPGDRTKAAIAGINTTTGNSGGALGLFTSAGAALVERLRITQYGDIGIGTSAPESKLHIIDAAGTNNILLQSTTNALNETMGIAFGTQPGDRTKAAIASVNTNTGNPAGALALYTNTGAGLAEKMRITATGNVGIGTTSPDQPLTVNGTIHSTSVLVDLNVSAPDYVFNKDYHLPTLAELKAYTDKNHHLPDVPAAAEIEKNGLNLGDMNLVLLKKVEELTLYLMEKDKQLQEQQKINQSVFSF